MEKDNLARTISKNSIFTVIYNVWYLGSRLVLTPLILSYITIEEYGLWSYCFVVLGYLALTAFGFNSTYIRYAADYRSRNENEKLNALLSTGMISMTLFSSVLFVLFWLLLPWLIRVLGIDPALRQTAEKLMIGTAVIFVANFTLAGYQSILEGEQRIALVRKIHLIASILEIVLILLFFNIGLGVFSLLWAYVGRLLLVIVCTFIFAHKVFPFLRLRVKYFSREELKKFTGFGNQMNLLGFLALVINSVDRLLITKLMNLGAVGMYEIGRKLPNIGLMLPSSIAGTVMPAASHLQGSAQHERLKRIYLDATRYLMIFSSIPYIYLIMFASPIIEVWVGKGYDQAVRVMQVCAVGTFINLLTGIGTACVRGIGKPKYEIQYMAISTVLIIASAPFLIHVKGVVGAALAYTLGQTVGSVFFLWIANRLFEVSWRQFAAKVLTPIVVILLLGVPPFAACNAVWSSLAASRWIGLAVLFAGGVAYVLVTLAVFVLFQKRLFSDEERKNLLSLRIPSSMGRVWAKLWRIP